MTRFISRLKRKIAMLMPEQMQYEMFSWRTGHRGLALSKLRMTGDRSRCWIGLDGWSLPSVWDYPEFFENAGILATPEGATAASRAHGR